MKFISEGIFEKYSKMKIFVFGIFEKGQISGLAPSELKFFLTKFNGSIFAYTVFYLPIFRRSKGYRKKRGPGRVNLPKIARKAKWKYSVKQESSHKLSLSLHNHL